MRVLKAGTYLLAGSLVVFMPLILAGTAFAASARLYLSPSSSSVAGGSTFTVDIREDSDAEPVNAVEVHLNYSADKLEYVSTTSSSAFGVVAAESGGAGVIAIERGANPAVTGDQLVATVRFKAKSSSGSTDISVGKESKIVSQTSNENVLSSATGGSYSFRAAPKGQTPDTIPPKISDVKVVNITSTSAEVTWTTTEPATSEVSYGENAAYGLAAADSQLVTDHRVKLSPALLSAGNVYHYMVKSVDVSGNAVSSADASFSMRGFPLAISVVNSKNKPVEGAKITIAGKSANSGKDGKATISDLPAGKQSGTVEYKGKKTAVSVTILTPKDGDPVQSVTFKIETGSSRWLVGLLLVVGLVAVAVAVWWVKKRRGGPGSAPLSGGTIIGPSSGPSKS